MSNKRLKWQQEYIEFIRSLSNHNLLNEVLADARGDGWEGCFTKRGSWRFDYATDELRRRLGASEKARDKR